MLIKDVTDLEVYNESLRLLKNSMNFCKKFKGQNMIQLSNVKNVENQYQQILLKDGENDLQN